MGLLSLSLCLAALLAGAGAQSPANSSSPTVWAAVAFIMYGEHTPLVGPFTSTLTPAGAQQMYSQGAAFRARYLSGNATLNSTDNTPAPINGIETTAIDNSQLTIVSNTDSYVVQGAMAFLQGLYPAAEGAFDADVGGLNISHSTATGKFTDYPLGGYQYPVIYPLFVDDENSVPLQGQVSCTEWQGSTEITLREQENMQASFNSSIDLYQTLWSTPPLVGTIELEYANFWNACLLYDYVNYMYNHNQTVYDGLNENYPGVVLELERLAEALEFEMTTNLTVNGLHQGDMIRAIPGRTLAEGVLAQFNANQAWDGSEAKLTLMFGSFEPMLSFFALADLIAVYNGPQFERLPQPGAAIIFELIGDDPNNPGVYPDEDDLKVRFVFRNSTDDGDPFLDQAIFGVGNEDDIMPYKDFQNAMSNIAMDVTTWCQTCGSIQDFCIAREVSVSNGGGSKAGAKNPVVAGVIGGASVAAVSAVAGILACIFGGLRVHRVNRKDRKSSGLGGFKGAEKMASDADLTVAKGGVRHERIGSWELRDGKQATVSKDFSPSKGLDDDAISVIGATPVKPQESL